MTRSRFVRLLRVRGPALEGWPREDRDEARRLIAVSPRCRAHFLAAIETDPALEDGLSPAVLDRLARGVARRIAAEATAGSFVQPAWPIFSPAAWGALAACGVVGAWLGWQELPAQPAPMLLASVQITALDGGQDAP